MTVQYNGKANPVIVVGSEVDVIVAFENAFRPVQWLFGIMCHDNLSVLSLAYLSLGSSYWKIVLITKQSHPIPSN